MGRFSFGPGYRLAIRITRLFLQKLVQFAQIFDAQIIKRFFVKQIFQHGTLPSHVTAPALTQSLGERTCASINARKLLLVVVIKVFKSDDKCFSPYWLVLKQRHRFWFHWRSGWGSIWVPENMNCALTQGPVGFHEIDFRFWFWFEKGDKCCEHVRVSLMQINVTARTLKVRVVAFSDKDRR
jgi:hypothetical protein